MQRPRVCLRLGLPMSTTTHQNEPRSIVHEWDKLCVAADRAEHGDHGLRSNYTLDSNGNHVPGYTYGRFGYDYVGCPRCKADLALMQSIRPRLLGALIGCFYAVDFEHSHRDQNRRDDCDICQKIIAVYEADGDLEPGALRS